MFVHLADYLTMDEKNPQEKGTRISRREKEFFLGLWCAKMKQAKQRNEGEQT